MAELTNAFRARLGVGSPPRPPAVIVITGGVYSGTGKGVVAASIAVLLRAASLRVVNVKWDGYHNQNAGTLNPKEHGECFVTDDRHEVDLDFGHYERFGGGPVRGAQSITRGRLSARLAALEREGRYAGRTIQEIPHLRDLLVEMVSEASQTPNAPAADVIIFEIGGTVGDDESNLAMHAALAMGRHALFVHVAPLSYTVDRDEPKTKPVQHSLLALQARGIFANLLVVRTKHVGDLTPDCREKLAADVVVEAPNLTYIYALPGLLLRQGIGPQLAQLVGREIQLGGAWITRISQLSTMHARPRRLVVAICGKYTSVADSYASIKEALVHASVAAGVCVEARLVNAEEFSGLGADVHALIVPGGYGPRGVPGMIAAITEARTRHIPFLGICYGMHLAIVEFARNVCGLPTANTTEVDPGTQWPVVILLPGQVAAAGPPNAPPNGPNPLPNAPPAATQRLGAYTANLAPGSIVRFLYGQPMATERHRHRWEVNPDYRPILENHGLKVTGTEATNADLIEFVELPRDRHFFFVATQAHPELKSTLLAPAPLFVGLVQAACVPRMRPLPPA